MKAKFFGVPMSFRRVGGLAGLMLATALCISCGQVYRPVVIPINPSPPNSANFHAVYAISTNSPFYPGTAVQIDVSGDSEIAQGNAGFNPTHIAILPNFSRVFVTSGAGNLCPSGTDVVTSYSPAADIGNATGFTSVLTYSYPNAGTSETANIVSISESATLVTATLNAPLPNATAGQSIIISSVPIPTGITTSAYNGCFPIVSIANSASGATLTYNDSITGLPPLSSGGGAATLPIFCPYLPDYVTTASNTSVYVANFGTENSINCPDISSTDSVALLNPSQASIPNIQYYPGTHPVAMVETPDALNLYVLNQGTNTINDLSPIDLTPLIKTPIPLPAGSTNPVWAVSRVDARRVYVLSQGDGKLHTINTATNTIISSLPVGGPGANYVVYDPNLNRLYVTNPAAGSIFVFAATGGPNDTPVPLPAGTATGGQMLIPAPSVCTAGTCGTVTPVSIAVLPDGSRFYVASYATTPAGTCPDSNVTPATTGVGCIIPQVTVYDAASFTVKPVSSANSLLAPGLSLLTNSLLTTPQAGSPGFFAATQYAVAPTAYCSVSNVPYTPSAPRFRMSAAAAPDSTHVYVSLCDAGVVADIDTTTSSIATGTNTPDILKTDLAAPYSVGTPLANGEPALQNPTFLLTGQ
jgi:DNA-binding beta-propeller fold protein YncE